MVGKTKAPAASATLEEAPEAAAEASAATEAPAEPAAEPAPAENGEKKDEEKKEEAPAEDKKKKKKVKKVVPSWATLSDEARSKLAKAGSMQRPKMTDAIVEAIKVCGNSKGLASASSIRAMIMTDHPDLPKMVLKKAMTKAIEQGMVTQVKGNGFSGSFKLGKGKPAVKKAADGKKGAKKARSDRQPLEEIFPLVFTWACNPKEASVGLIKKYLVANYPDLDLGVEMKHYRKALENAEKNGTLERLSGKGFSGTFQLVDGANKSGAKFEDAFENACIAMNEPKDVSVAKLRDYLSVYHAEYNTDNKPKVLKSALDRAVAKGWITQISGKGFSGTYRLCHPYYPSPRELWGKDFVEPKERTAAKAEPSPKKKAVKRAAESESEDESSEEEEEEEAYKPKKGKRGPPSPRKTVEPAPKKKAKAAPAKKPAAKKAAAKPVVAKKSKPPGKGAVNKSRKGASRGKK